MVIIMWNKIKAHLPTYIIAVAIPLAVGTLAAWLTRDSMNIYSEINTPPLSPPGWLFPIVWTILYVLMGVSSALVYINREINPDAVMRGLTSYGISLALNFLWSILFFNFRLYLFAFICLVLLLYFIIMSVLYYKKVSPLAAYLQIPYIVWVAFAGYLNIVIYSIN